MTTIITYSTFCIKENKYVTYNSSTGPLNYCPNDSRHSIDPARTTIVNVVFEEAVNIPYVYIASKAPRGTGGRYRDEGFKYDITLSSNIVINDYLMPINQCMFGMKFCASPENKGDTVDMLVNPGTVVGAIMQNIDNTMNSFNVNSTVSDNVIPGYYILIGDEERLVTRVEISTLTLYVEAPFTNSYNIGSLISVNMYAVRAHVLDCPGIHEVGYGALGGQLVPAGSVVRMVYHNNTSNIIKTFSLNAEYMY